MEGLEILCRGRGQGGGPLAREPGPAAPVPSQHSSASIIGLEETNEKLCQKKKHMEKNSVNLGTVNEPMEVLLMPLCGRESF